MALMSSMFRSQAILGTTDGSWFQEIAGRQGGRWADQHVRAAMAPRPPSKSERLKRLKQLHDQGIVTDAEFDAMRSKLSL